MDKLRVSKAIEIVSDSLISHLPKQEDSLLAPCCQKAIGSPTFHRKCVQEYYEVLGVLVDLL